MASSVTKSPNRNSNSRSSEINNPMRRSFGGSTFSKPSVVTKPKGFSVTPANSPADFPRRNSISRENIPSLPRNHHGDKENGKEQEPKPARLRSPSPFKGSKNFMSPTISAASKVTASPKKKILAEKNESVRTSFSSSDGKASLNSVSFSDVLKFIDVKSEAGPGCDSVAAAPSEANHKLADSKAPLISNSLVFDQKVPSTPKNDSKLKPDSHDLDLSSIGSSPHVSHASLAPLDADPLLRPYDAETNFTSPRPQFLRYRPNPRIEGYLNKARQGNALEDSFVSDSSSSAELTEETETQSEESQTDSETSSKEIVQEVLHVSEPKAFSAHMSKESSVVSSAEVVQQEEVLRVFEPNPFGAQMFKESKPQFFRRPKTVAFLLTILVACLSVSVTDSPVVGLVLKDPSHPNFFYVPSEFTEYAKAQWDGLAQNFGIWYAQSVAYLSELVFKFRAHKSGPLKYINLTSLYDDQYLVNVLESDSVIGLEKMVVVETDQLGEKACREVEEQGNDGEASGHDEWECEEQQEHEKVKEIQEDCEIPTSEVHIGLVAEHESIIHDKIEIFEAHESIVHDKIEVFEAHDIGEVVPDELHLTPEAEGPKTDIFEADLIQEDNDLAPEMATTEPKESSESSKTVDFHWLSDEALNLNAMGMCLLALLAAAGAAFYIFARKGNTASSVPTASICSVPVDQPLLLAKKFDISPKSVCASVDHSLHERLVGETCHPSEVDMVGESCPSEMSSFQKSSSYSKKGAKDYSGEAQSEERKMRRNHKRESLASSDYSVGSISTYGSFTTYEKISAKHANGGEITPVRRSSRIIRKQVTSP